MPHGAYREEEKRERTVYFKIVCKSNSFSLLGLDNNYLFLWKINSRIFLMEPNVDKQVVVYLKGNCLL